MIFIMHWMSLPRTIWTCRNGIPIAYDLFPGNESEKVQVNVTKPGQKKPAKKKVVADQKQMVYYSEKI